MDKGTTYFETDTEGVRLKTETTTVYQFDALDERAKERARDWYREGMTSPDDWQADTVLDDAARLAALFGLNIRTRPVKLMGGSTRYDPDVYYEVCDRNEGLTFAGSYRYRKGSVRAVAAEAPSSWTDRESGETKTHKSNEELNRIVKALADVQRRNSYRLTASASHGRSRSHFMDISVEYDDYRTNGTADAIDVVTQCLRDFAAWICANLAAEYEYQSSAECIDETIRANEYEFTEEGKQA